MWHTKERNKGSRWINKRMAVLETLLVEKTDSSRIEDLRVMIAACFWLLQRAHWFVISFFYKKDVLIIS